EAIAHSIISQITSQEKSLRELETQKEELLSSLNKIRNSKTDVDFEYKQNNDQRNWLKEQSRNLDEKIADYSKLIIGMEESIIGATKEIDALKQQENGLKLNLSDIPISELQNNIHQYETNVVICRQKFNNINDSISNVNDRITEEKVRFSDLKSRLEDLKSTINSITIEEKKLHDQEQSVSKQLGELLLKNITPLEQQLKELESLYAQRQKLEAELQKESILKERQTSQIQIELTRKNERLENLKERIEDDFGLVDFEYNPHMMGPTPLPFQDLVIESLPVRHELPEDLGENIKEMKIQLRRIGDVNSEAQVEYQEVLERYNFLTEQVKDLETASVDLNKVINELEEIMQRDFLKTFKAVSVEFSRMFTRLFNGGTAKLLISDENDPIESGIDIEARLPGRREQGLVLLSGGERSLAAVALIFALLKVSPTPFCVLDEVDAMLDESNVGRFCDLLKELSNDTQFILITHNRNTVQAADVIYGVTMGRDSTSQVISLKLDEVDQTYIE
ncbi:MAG: hypothetical protein MUO40_12835, partial [Anaerolineaceae bacterium]|nr:hypothetical protein [Anaerolineaceae bacterium]